MCFIFQSRDRLTAITTVAEAYSGLGAIAAESGISRESLYRALSSKGNPTLKTFLAVLNIATCVMAYAVMFSERFGKSIVITDQACLKSLHRMNWCPE